MKKKIMAVCLASALMMATVPASYAAVPPEFVGLAQGAFSSIEAIKVPTDIKLKDSAEADYQNGPVTLNVKDAESTSFDFRAEIAMKSIKDAMNQYVAKAKAGLKLLGKSDEDINDAVKSCYVKGGQFIITVTYPTDGIEIPASFVSNKGMSDFTSTTNKHNDVFEETVDRQQEAGKITITVDVKGGTTLTLDELDSKLDDLILTCTGVKVSKTGTYKVVGKVEGKTTISSGSDDLGDITYNFVQGDSSAVAIDGTAMNMEKDRYANDGEVSGTIVVQSSSGGSLGNGSATAPRKTLTIVIGDGIDNNTITYANNMKVSVDSIPVPSRPGYKFAGFYSDPELTNALEGEIEMSDNMTIYTKWEKEEVNPPLDTAEHFAYIIGYPTEDGSKLVRPDAGITREEIATIFYRLLKDETRNSLFTDENDFSDVAKDRWSNKAISTMAKGGYLTGYPDRTFEPAKEVTRAEVVAIATRFYNVTSDSAVASSALADIDGHWAKANINYAVEQGWINGYEDGTFKPNQTITRAEVMKIVNGILGRHVEESGLVEDAVRWDDNSKSAWYYYDVIEATNPHTYERAENETNEKWTAITANKVWEEKPTYEDASK